MTQKEMNTRNINPNEESSQSQTKQIAAWLTEGNTLTQMEALHRFGCFRLASRINDLRNAGCNIATERVVTSNGKRVASYRLIKEGE